MSDSRPTESNDSRAGAPFRTELARLIHGVRRAIRSTVEDKGYLEIAHPHLDPASDVAFYNAFRVTAPGAARLEGFVGTLLVSGGGYMLKAARALGHVYRIGPSFRVDPEERSNLLLEFSGVHISQEATLEQILALVEEMLQAMVPVVRPASPAWRATLEAMTFPLTRLSHVEAARLLSVPPETDFSLAQHFALLDKVGVPCLLMTHNPPSADAYATFHRLRDGQAQNFELITRWGGETLAGAEYETDEGALREQLASSRLLRRAVELGTPAREYAAPAIELLTMKDVPISSIYCGFERLIQFMGGIEQIREATLFPVTCDFLMAPGRGYARKSG